MRARSRQRSGANRCSGNDGFTLLELVVATSILAVGVVGVIGTMTSSFGIAEAARARSRAVAVATEHIEALRARPYAQLLVSDGVTEEDVEVGGTRFHVQRAVAWAAEGSVTNAYKSVTVQVTWTDSSGAHEIHQSSLVYPGGLGPLGSGSVLPAPGPGNPSAPTLAVGVALPGSTGVDLVWTPPVLSSPLPSSYVVQYATDPTFATYQQVTAAVPALTPLVRVDDLAPDTTYHFRVASKAANGNLSAGWAYSNAVHTPASSSTSCGVGTASVTPSAVTRTSTSALSVIPAVSVNLIGNCAATDLEMTFDPLGDGAGHTVALAGTTAVRSGQVGDASTVWTVGDHEIRVLDGGGQVRSTLRLIVCDHGKPTCP